MRIFILTILIFIQGAAFAQNEIDSLNRIEAESTPALQTGKTRSPGKAALFSAIFPGGGQIYNRKYWKLPIVYAGIGVSLYFGFYYRDTYLKYKEAYKMELNGDSSEFHNYLTPDGIRVARDQYRQWMETSYIIAGAFYVLQIVDALVDAHLADFDISDDLGMRIRPDVINYAAVAGPVPSITLAFYLKAPVNKPPNYRYGP